MAPNSDLVTSRVRGTPHEKVEFLQHHGIPYELKYTSSSAVLTTEYEKIIYSDHRTTKYELILRNSLKKEINTNCPDMVGRFDNQPRYFKWSDAIYKIPMNDGDVMSVRDCYEIDLVKAYYYTAKNLGYISEDFFQKTLKIPKQLRLRLLGSIASVKNIETFDGEVIDLEQKSDAKLRNIWHNIVCRTDMVLERMSSALGSHFLFYWVDGIYFTTFGQDDVCVKLVRQIAKKENFEVTTTRLESLEIQKVGQHLEAVIRVEGREKIFCVQSRTG